MLPGDPYSRVDYRRVIAWESRLERERALLEGLLDRAPERSVLDLGCGTGEHVAHFADLGVRAVGLDRSEAMLEAAREYEGCSRGRFVAGDLREAPRALGSEPAFGLVLCLGNVLPHLVDDEDLDAFAASAAECLLPRGILLIQIVNYEGILARGDRHLPINVRPGVEDGTEIVLLRLLAPGPKERLLFFPTTLTLDPEAENPVRVQATRRVELRPWTSAELVPGLERAGFSVERLGDVKGGVFDPATSPDLVLVATRL